MIHDLAVPGLDGSSVLGRPAPDFAAQTLGRGGVRHSELRGRYVLVQFSDADCLPCAKQEAVLESVSCQYKERGLVVL